MTKNFRILVVDDEIDFARLLQDILRDEGYKVETALDGKEALKKINLFSPHLVITDLKMPGMSGLELLREIKKKWPEIDCMVITAFGSIGSAVEAMKQGAIDYLTKPLDSPDQLRTVVKKAYEQFCLRQENLALKEAQWEGLPPFEIVFKGMEEVWELVKQVAPTEATVLLLGESGTGKGVVARVIHQLSQRKGPFIEVNCAALPENLIEAELFGYEKGAFTGAIKAKPGKFELADKGTLFLDEIAELPLTAQAKLLRVLQEKTFERLGGVTTLHTNARLIAATNQDLETAVREKRFREDLFYRLNVFPITLLPLRSRKEAIPALAKYLIQKLARQQNITPPALSDEVINTLMSYDWPGNVRELQNVLERSLILSRHKDTLILPPLGTKTSSSLDVPSLPSVNLKELEREAIKLALKKTGGHRKKAAELLGISLRSLQYKIKEYGLLSKEKLF
jgi:DNA-binding NtrC family response regulator